MLKISPWRPAASFLAFKAFIPKTWIRHSHYNVPGQSENVTLPMIYDKFSSGEPIVALTAHDALSARMANLAGVDILLVGDSLAMVAMGYEDTTQITLDDMIYHTRAVRRGATRPFIIADLPFGSYEQGPHQAVESGIAMIKRGRADMVKFEGGRELAATVKHMRQYGLACIPHIGLTPQRQIETGGFKVQGRTAPQALAILEDAVALQEAGAFMLLLEGVPGRVAEEIQARLSIPIIGIGAGRYTAGQVLVQLDMLGAFDAFTPKFLKRYASMLTTNVAAIQNYCAEVRSGAFPGPEHGYKIKDAELEAFTRTADSVATRRR